MLFLILIHGSLAAQNNSIIYIVSDCYEFSVFVSEKSEMIFKNHFLTILFPIDRFAEMGPSSRTFFSNNGFTCLQVLDHIYAFYQVHDSIF